MTIKVKPLSWRGVRNQRAMSPEETTMELPKVEKFEDLTFAQWIALGTKCGGLDNVKAVLLGTSSLTVTVVRRLSDPVAFAVPGANRNLKNFYQTRKGLWLSENFQNFLLAELPEGEVASEARDIVRADIEQEANDGEIGSELPKGNVFKDRDQFLNYLATMIEAQWGGTKGELLADGKANIFHVQIGNVPFSVFVTWRRVGSGWRCFAGPLDVRRWSAGPRAFGATAPKKL